MCSCAYSNDSSSTNKVAIEPQWQPPVAVVGPLRHVAAGVVAGVVAEVAAAAAVEVGCDLEGDGLLDCDDLRWLVL